MQPNIHVTVVSRGGGWKEYIRGNNDHNFSKTINPQILEAQRYQAQEK